MKEKLEDIIELTTKELGNKIEIYNTQLENPNVYPPALYHLHKICNDMKAELNYYRELLENLK